MPWRASTGRSSSSQRANASSQVTSRHVVAVAHHRRRAAVGVVVQVPERRALRAEIALASRRRRVGADQRDLLVLDVDLEAAHRLAQRTGPQVHRRPAAVVSVVVIRPGATRFARARSSVRPRAVR